MRKTLKNLGDDERHTFIGVFERFGKRHGYKHSIGTVLLKNIQLISADTNELVPISDHLWFDLTQGFEQAKLNSHDVVKFDARVSLYVKGYKGYRNYDLRFDRPLEIDYRLSYPTKVTNLGNMEIKDGENQ